MVVAVAITAHCTIAIGSGQRYCAMVGSHEHGDLCAHKGAHAPLAVYGHERQYASFGLMELLHFGVQFYNDGHVLSW